MTTLTTIEIEPPYLLFIGDMDYELDAKTAFGIAHWRPKLCLAQLRFGTAVDLGLPDMTPKDAVAVGARSLIVGVAPVGGSFPETWVESLVEAASSGLHIVAGMHTRLDQVPGLSEAATEAGVRLVDVRKSPPDIPGWNGRQAAGPKAAHRRYRLCGGKEVHRPGHREGDVRARHEGDLPRDRADGHHDCR